MGAVEGSHSRPTKRGRCGPMPGPVAARLRANGGGAPGRGQRHDPGDCPGLPWRSSRRALSAAAGSADCVAGRRPASPASGMGRMAALGGTIILALEGARPLLTIRQGSPAGPLRPLLRVSPGRQRHTRPRRIGRRWAAAPTRFGAIQRRRAPLFGVLVLVAIGPLLAASSIPLRVAFGRQSLSATSPGKPR